MAEAGSYQSKRRAGGGGPQQAAVRAAVAVWLCAALLRGAGARLPDFVIMGTQKGGTTAARKVLHRHPDVCSPDREINFWLDGQGVYDGDWSAAQAENISAAYQRFFHEGCLQAAGGGEVAAVGDTSPDYMSSPHKVAARMARVLPPATQLVFLLRNPVSRTFSAYHMLRQWGRFKDHTFEEMVKWVIALEDSSTMNITHQEVLDEWQQRHLDFTFESILVRSKYVEQLRKIQQHMDQSRMHVLFSENIFEHSDYGPLYDLIGVKRVSNPPKYEHYTGRYHERGEQMTEVARGMLQDYFQPYNRQLCKWLRTAPTGGSEVDCDSPDFGWDAMRAAAGPVVVRRPRTPAQTPSHRPSGLASRRQLRVRARK